MIIFKVSTNKARAMLERLERDIPKASVRGVKKVAGNASKQYLLSAKHANIRSWRGLFYKSLQRQIEHPAKLGTRTFGVSIAAMTRRTSKGLINYFISLDRMKPHFVQLQKRRIITKWAYDRLGLEGRLLKGVWVKPHPFIRRAERRIMKSVVPIMEKEINREMKK